MTTKAKVSTKASKAIVPYVGERVQIKRAGKLLTVTVSEVEDDEFCYSDANGNDVWVKNSTIVAKA